MREYWAVGLKIDHWIGSDGRIVARFARGKFSRREALRHAADHETESKVVHVTCKPKAPPPLQVGDEVVVRGRVNAIGDGTWIHVTVDGRGAGKSDYGFARTALERVKP